VRQTAAIGCGPRRPSGEPGHRLEGFGNRQREDLTSAADAAGASDEVIARLQAAHGEQFEDGDELRAALDPD